MLICIDTVRYDSFLDPGVSDALDAWLVRAQVYDNAMSAAPWTVPSVATVLTGLYPIEHGAGRFEGEVANLSQFAPTPLAADRSTLAEILGEHGLQTGAFVSQPFLRAGLGLDQGFETLELRRGWAKDVHQFWRWKDSLAPDQRFFGYLHFMEAHDRHLKSPNILSTRLAQLEERQREAVRQHSTPEACQNPDGIPCLRNQVYNAAVLKLRAALASILQDLERRGLLDKTVVMVYSDHGEEFWDHWREEQAAGEDPRGRYGVGHGQSLYQELLHVPLLAWVPGWPGTRHEELVSLADVAPSLLHWLGYDPGPFEMSGSLLPGPLDSGGATRSEAVFASGISYGPEKISARAGDLKTIYTPSRERFEYFDLDKDPGEHGPVVDDGLTMMFDTLVGDYVEMERSSDAVAGRYDKQQLQALQAIGYLQGVSIDSRSNNPPAPSDASAGNPETDEMDK